MRCDECQEKLGLYWELPDQDADKVAIDLHLLDCPSCAEQFRLWEESDWMIRSLSELEDKEFDDRSVARMNQSVMDRIYADNEYLRPVHDRTYRFTTSFRFRSGLLIAGCLAIFFSGLLYAVIGDGGSTARTEPMTGLLETANAGGDGVIIGGQFYAEVPVASISDPFVLKVVPTVPQYWIVFSLFGVITTLLLSNWFARTRR
ncbi:anti-sigma factor family protein [Paenibacillus xylaniclasticus]|uniref:anti-sigma factor family protein n=1 Tax=Paenibacillus xylaniclasticus TaxID=588083 RepID=UPI000FDA4BB5|nr:MULTISPECIES: zf-HC2 domain-containing protein [Paenibacillus]GFN30663.1 hypothetical protein PCURB6_09230 [Paenibacillus curdlanolyticus]